MIYLLNLNNKGCMNLLNETIEILKEHNKSSEDVLWVGSYDLFFTWKSFKSLSDKEYNDGFGGQEVIPDLLIVGDNWWLERHEYDGSEWWEFKKLPIKPLLEKIPARVFREDYEDNLIEVK